LEAERAGRAYIAADNQRAATALDDAYERVLATTLAQNARYRAPVPLDRGSPAIGRFRNYLIFYRRQNDEVEVLRVLHGARDIRSILDP
jgi:toxin ParE1/3/4